MTSMSSNTPSSPSKNNAAAPAADGEAKVSNFLRQIIAKFISYNVKRANREKHSGELRLGFIAKNSNNLG